MISQYAADRLLNHLLGTKDIKFQRMYLGLYNGHPSRGAGKEVDDSSYARKPIVFNPAQDGVAKSAIEVVFDMANSGWGTITHFGVFDARGNPYFFGELTAHVTPANNQSIRFPSGFIHVVIDPGEPTDTADSVIWMDGYDGTTMWTDSGGTEPVLIDGNPIASWDSKVGSVTFQGGTFKPVMSRGVDMSGLFQEHMDAEYTNASTSWTLFAKFEETATGTDTYILDSETGSLSFGTDIGGSGPGIDVGGADRNASGAPASSIGEKIVVWRVNPTAELFVNMGFSEYGGTVTAYTATDMDDTLRIGNAEDNGLWTPAELGAGLWAWWDPSDASTVTLNGSGEITQIDDKSGNGRHLTNTGVVTPATINGWNAVQGTDDSSAYLGWTGTPGFDGFYSVADTGLGDNFTLMTSDDTSEYFGQSEEFETGVSRHSNAGSVSYGLDYIGDPGSNRDEFFTNTIGQHVISAVSVDPSAWGALRPWHFGTGSNFQFGGQWGEVILTDSIGASDDEKVSSYLLWKYGLEGYLFASGETYEDEPPFISSPNNKFTGIVRELILYERVLSDDEVEGVIESMTSRESHPSQLVGTNVWNWSIINLGANDGASVSSVRDRSALRNDLTGNSFIYTEGMGLSGYMETDHDVTLTSGFTFMCVANITNKTADTGLIQSASDFGDDDTAVLDLAFDANGNLVQTSNRAGTISSNRSRQTIPTGEDVLLTVHVPDATTGIVRLNGQNVGDDPSGGDLLPDTAEPVRVGRGYGVSLDGYIKDVVIAGPELGAGEQNQLEAAMMKLWGIERPFSHAVFGIENQSDPIIYGDHSQGYDGRVVGNYYDDAILTVVDPSNVVAHYSFESSGGLAPDEVTSATLFVWLDANDVTTLWEENTASTQATDNSEVNRWDNKATGSAISYLENVTDGATNSDIEYLTDGFWGMPTVLFKDTAEAYMKSDVTTTEGGTNITIVWVGQNKGDEDTHQYLVAKDNANFGVWAAPERASGSGPGFYDGAHKDFGYEVTMGEPDIWIWEYDDNTARFYNRKTQLGNDTAHTSFSTSADELEIPTTPLSDLSISELIIYTGVLSTEDREALVDHLQLKWNLYGRGAPELILSEKLVTHFDFSDPSVCFTDTAMTTNVSSDSDNLQAVVDKGRGGTIISEGTNYPLWRTGANGINGLGAAEFDGTNDLLSGHFANRDLSGDYTIIAAIEPNGTQGYLLDNTNNGGRIEIRPSAQPSWVQLYAGSSFNSTGNPTFGAYLLECIVADAGDDSVISNNGTPDTGTAGSANFGGSNIYVGSNSSSASTYGGLIGELMVIEGTLSTDERASIYTYLESKWGI